MSFLPLHRDKKHKFKNGHWTWNESAAKLKFHSHETNNGDNEGIKFGKSADKHKRIESDVGLRFASSIDEPEEKVFREIFQRPNSFYDSDVITIQDVKNLTLFTLKSQATRKFIEFLYTTLFDKFLHAIILYVDLYLLVLEFLLIRRDELSEGKVRDTHSMKVERFLSKQLSDRRLLIAREYSKILLKSNNNDVDDDCDDAQKKKSKRNKKKSLEIKLSAEMDLIFYESLIDFTIQCTFIAMHRRSFNAISCELNRLFRTEFFNIAKSDKRCQFEFNFREQQILYGQNCFENSLKNYRQQHSPLICEILRLSPTPENEVILKIGYEKYFGSNKYLFHLELDFTTPECHLHLIGVRRGILGHPKSLYDTMLNLNESALRKMNWSEEYDPYGLIRKVFFDIHTSDDFSLERRKNLSTRLIIHREPYGGAKDQLKLWKRKEFIMKKNLKQSILD